MVIFETSVFTKRIDMLMDDENYRALQNMLVRFPDLGKIIRGSGGVRKLRWACSDRGKRGGARILYYWLKSEEQIYMLFAYTKSTKDDLTSEQLSQLKDLVYRELNHG